MVQKNGFDLSPMNPDPGVLCQYIREKKVSNQWGHFPCESSAVAVYRFSFQGQEMSVPFCGLCLARLINEFVARLANA